MSSEQIHPLDATVALVSTSPNHYQGNTHPAYANMVGPFGGVIGATLLNAVLSHPDLLGDPLSQTVHYAAPIADGSFSISARPLRTNRSTQHWLVELEQNEQIAAFATIVTAVRRDTWGVTDAAFPSVPPSEQMTPSAAIPAVVWTNNYEMRFISGELDIGRTDSGSSHSCLWIRDQPPRPLDFVSLSAICDAFFPRIFVRRPKWVAVGTVALTTYFHADRQLLEQIGSQPVLASAKALHFGKGFFDQTAEVWSPDGQLLAATHQVVYYKE